jgi:hypothetical protein
MIDGSDQIPGAELPPVYSGEQLAERDRRKRILDGISEYRTTNEGAPIAEACRAFGVNQATYSRWRDAFASGGIDELIPGKPTGRPDKFPEEVFTFEVRQKLSQIYLKTESHAATLLIFRNDPLCPQCLRDWHDEQVRLGKSRHQIPPSLRKMMEQTPAMHDKFRGPRRYELNQFTTFRDMYEILEDGTERLIEPGDWWEMDDMSMNYPFWFPSPWGDSKLAHRHHCDIGRQSLCAMDVGSGKWLGVDLIGRPRDAYRAEDILRTCRKLFCEFGLPRRGLRLERGIWKSKRITGYDVDDNATAAKESEREVGGIAEEEKEKVCGGLRELGIEVRWVHSPKTKGFIETGFNFFQRIMSGI